MGIVISETDKRFHVPYGPLNHDGTPQESFLDCKAHPEWIPTLPACVGWPETQRLLQAINTPDGPWMSLAAFQDVIVSELPGQEEFPCALTSMLSFCYADIQANEKKSFRSVSEGLSDHLSTYMQASSNRLQETLNVEILLELQPTAFHHLQVTGWSLTVYVVSSGDDYVEARSSWCVAIQGLQDWFGHG